MTKKTNQSGHLAIMTSRIPWWVSGLLAITWYKPQHSNIPSHANLDTNAVIINNVYAAYIVKDNVGMNEFADSLSPTQKQDKGY